MNPIAQLLGLKSGCATFTVNGFKFEYRPAPESGGIYEALFTDWADMSRDLTFFYSKNETVNKRNLAIWLTHSFSPNAQRRMDKDYDAIIGAAARDLQQFSRVGPTLKAL